MAGRRQLPPVDELVRMRDKGMKLKEIADHVFETSGEKVTSAAVSVALSRAGHAKEKQRYEDLIPWRVQMAHQKHLFLRMLRAEARRRQLGEQSLTPQQLRRLNEFKAELKELGAVVHYNPAKEPGFHAVPARPGIDTDLIRVPEPDLASV